MLDARMMARLLGGDLLRGNRIVAPGPGHSRRDRSMSILLSDTAPDGFIVNSFAGDDPLDCKDYIRECLGITVGGSSGQVVQLVDEPDDTARTMAAAAIWMAAAKPAGTPVEAYLASRGLGLPDAVRWHPQCPFASGRTGAMVALVTDIATNEPKAIHRTAIDPHGRKIEVGGHDRLSLGPIGGGAVKLTPDADVTQVIGVGEGIESTLSLRRLDGLENLPVWSLLTANGIRSFPVLPGIESVFVAVDQDEAGIGAADALGTRWTEAGREVMLVEPAEWGRDVNDLVRAHVA